MNQSNRMLLGLAMVTLLLVGRSAAQGSQPTSVRDMIIEDSLTPAKAQLRADVTALRDTLYRVSAIQNQIARARNTGMTSVLIARGRDLNRTCRVGRASVLYTKQRVAGLKTSKTVDGNAERNFNAFRAALDTLDAKMLLCQHDDSVTMAAPTPDAARIDQIATAASTAVAHFDRVRDDLLKLLGIHLPVTGNMSRN